MEQQDTDDLPPVTRLVAGQDVDLLRSVRNLRLRQRVRRRERREDERAEEGGAGRAEELSESHHG